MAVNFHGKFQCISVQKFKVVCIFISHSELRNFKKSQISKYSTILKNNVNMILHFFKTKEVSKYAGAKVENGILLQILVLLVLPK